MHVDRVVAVVDCGQVINPDTVEAQLQSGIIFGISAALWGEITLKDGRVEQSNFDNYRVLRIDEAPKIEIEIVNNGEAPGGIGEPGTSALMPAVANGVKRRGGFGKVLAHDARVAHLLVAESQLVVGQTYRPGVVREFRMLERARMQRNGP